MSEKVVINKSSRMVLNLEIEPSSFLPFFFQFLIRNLNEYFPSFQIVAEIVETTQWQLTILAVDSAILDDLINLKQDRCILSCPQEIELKG